jgi:hypothetical protein
LEKATVEHNKLGYKKSFARLFLILQRSMLEHRTTVDHLTFEIS